VSGQLGYLVYCYKKASSSIFRWSAEPPIFFYHRSVALKFQQHMEYVRGFCAVVIAAGSEERDCGKGTFYYEMMEDINIAHELGVERSRELVQNRGGKV